MASSSKEPASIRTSAASSSHNIDELVFQPSMSNRSRPPLHRQQCAKGRKFANNRVKSKTRSTRTQKINSTTKEARLNYAFSISSESNTSQTELQGNHHEEYSSKSWYSGCCVWIQQILKDAIEQLLMAKGIATIREIKRVLEEGTSEITWSQIPPEGLDIGVLYASLQGHAGMLRCFLQLGGNSNSIDLGGRTALHYATSSPGSDAIGCINLLLEHGAVVNAWDANIQATPLFCAAASGRIELLDRLLKANADVNIGLNDAKHVDGSTALLWAVRARSVNCASRLIDAGALVNSTRVYSETPVHVASAQGDLECLRLLLKHQADIRVLCGTERRNPLHLAASEGHVGCVRMLLQTSKDEINARDARGRTPLHLAAQFQSVECVTELLKNGARHDIYDSAKRTALHCAVVKSSRSTDVVRQLISFGADVNARDEMEQTPLHLAAICENSKLATILIQSRADLSAKNKGGSSALAFIVRRVPAALSAIPRLLDSAVVLADHDPADPDCQLQLDFRVLLASSGKHHSKELDLLTTLVLTDQHHVLQHPVIRAFLHLKWFKIRSLFLISLLFHAIFVVTLSLTILSDYVLDKRNSSHEFVSDVPASDQDSYPRWAVDAIRYLTLSFGTLLALKELFQLCQHPQVYLRDLENYAQVFLIGGMVAVCTPIMFENPDHEWRQHLAALVVIVAWVVVMMHVGRFPVFGLYVQMFTAVATNVFKLLVAYLSLIIGFSLGFAVLCPTIEFFSQIPNAFLTTIVMMTGELAYDKIFYDDKPIQYVGTAHLVFLCFLLFVVIVLMNLLVGLAVSDIQGLRKSAGLDRLVRLTRLIARMENLIFFPWLAHLPCCVTSLTPKLLKRKLLVVPRVTRSYTFRPNDPRDLRFPPDIKESLLKIIIQGKAVKKGQHLHIYRTTTPLVVTEENNAELFEEVIHRVDDLFHNYMSQIIMMNNTVEEQLSRLTSSYCSQNSQPHNGLVME